MMLAAACLPACCMRWESRWISRLSSSLSRGRKRFLPTTSAICGQPPELLRTHYYITGLNIIISTTRGKGKGKGRRKCDGGARPRYRLMKARNLWYTQSEEAPFVLLPLPCLQPPSSRLITGVHESLFDRWCYGCSSISRTPPKRPRLLMHR